MCSRTSAIFVRAVSGHGCLVGEHGAGDTRVRLELREPALDGAKGVDDDLREIRLEGAVAAAVVFRFKLMNGFAAEERVNREEVGDRRFVFAEADLAVRVRDGPLDLFRDRGRVVRLRE